MRLYSPLAGRLSAYCLAKTHNREEAKEFVSETILAAYENFEKLKNEKAFLSFLFTIASNLIIVKYKHSQRMKLTEPEQMDSFIGFYDNPEQLMDIKILMQGLEQLNNDQKEAIYLFYIMGLSQKEISAIQNTTIINVKLRIFRGKKKLAEILEVNNSEYRVNENKLLIQFNND